jgi:hypothetical protein
MRLKAFALALFSAVLGAALLAGAVGAKKPSAQDHKAQICHQRGNGTFKTITVSKKAVPAHVAHGDTVGACDELETITVTSDVLQFGPNGWGGWSCPASHPQVVDAEVQQPGGGDPLHPYDLYVWEPGATAGGVSYPATPFGYTYGAGETGAIVQNGGTGQDLVIVLTCREV